MRDPVAALTICEQSTISQRLRDSIAAKRRTMPKDAPDHGSRALHALEDGRERLERVATFLPCPVEFAHEVVAVVV